MHERSMGYLRLLRLQDTYRFRKVHVRVPRGSLLIPCRHGDIRTFRFAGTVRSVWMPCGLGNTRTVSGAGPYGVQWGPRGSLEFYLPSQIRLCDIWPIKARKTTNWPSMGTKSLVAHVWKLYMLNLQPWDIRHNSKFFETSFGLAMPCDFPRVYTGLVLTGPTDCPGVSCDIGIKYLMLRSHIWDPRVCPGA